MASRRAQVSAPATVSWCSPWFLAVLVAFIGGISLGSLRSGGTALGWGAAGTAGTATAAAPMKRSKSAASAGLRPAGKGAGRRRRRAAIEESELEDGVAAVPAALPVKEKLGIVPPPPKPDGEPFSLSFYDGKSITVYPHIDHGAGGNNWWNTVPGGWEMDTLQAMRFFHEQAKKAGRRSIQIDFGCWVAPTALFSASYADQVYAMEPDPEAYREAWHNIQLNPTLSPKIAVRQLCISDKAGKITLHGSKGDSMSSVFASKDPASRYQYSSWEVECTTLDAFIESEGINTDEITLIKVDTEGHEAPIMWQMRDWLKKHPNIVISLSIHAFLYPDVADPATALMHSQLRDVIMDYKTVIFTHGDPVHRDGFSVGGWCRLCSLILTNQDTPKGYSSWNLAFQGKEPDLKV